jgi:Rrf2 family transcriptional regulator, iron-sulfur cluster assembly transcription factor
VKVLAFIASQGNGPVLVRSISDGTDMPAAYLGKIVNTLARRRLVVTRRGPGGGVTLARPAAAISLFDVCRALDDPLTKERCMLSDVPCTEEGACPAHEFCKTNRVHQFEFLQRMTLVDIVAFGARRRGPATAVSATPRTGDHS